MPNLYLSVLGVVAILVTGSTLFSLWTNRERLSQEDLNDEDRSLIFRLTIFVIYPLIQFAGLKTTMAIGQFFGGYVKTSFFRLLWYNIDIGNLSPDHLFITFLSGFLVQLLIAGLFLFTLSFRPHPYLATLLGYSSVFVLFACLIIEPLMSLLGIYSSMWPLANSFSKDISLGIYACTTLAAAIFVLAVRNVKVRLAFASLSRPNITNQVNETIYALTKNPNNLKLIVRLGVLYSQAGLADKAHVQLKRLKVLSADSLYYRFFSAYLSYFKRNFKKAKTAFTLLGDQINSDPILKASFLSAAAISAVADRDFEAALNASDRALEFDDSSSVARMVKVDVFMQKGKKKAAQEEILLALKKGLDVNFENKIPLDVDQVLDLIEKQEQTSKKPARHTYSNLVK